MNWNRDIKLPRLLPTRPKLSRARASTPRRKPARHGEFVGLSIGASQLTAVVVTNDGAPKLTRAVHEPLAAGIVADGEVRDPAALVVALNRLFSAHSLPRKSVRVGIASSRIAVRTLAVPGVDDAEQLDNAISYRAHEMLPVPLEDSVIAYNVLGQGVDEEGSPTRQILLVVAYRESVERFAAALDEAGLDVAAIDLEAFALLRALVVPGTPGTATVAAAVGHERTVLAISDGSVCVYTRILTWGGSALTSAIARALKISPDEAEQVKRSLSYKDSAPPPPGLTAARAAEALEAVRGELRALVRELTSSLDFYGAQPGSLAVGDVLLSGGTLDLPGLGDEVEKQLGGTVRIAYPFARVTPATPPVESTRSGSLVIAIGLAIQDDTMTAVNLHAAGKKQRARLATGRRSLTGRKVAAATVVSALVIGGAVGVLVHSASSATSSKRAELARLDATLSAAQLKAVQARSEGSTGTARLAAIDTIVARRVAWDGLLDSISRVLPEDVWLTSLTAASPAAATVAVPVSAPSTTAVAAAPATPPAPIVALPFTVTGYTYSQPSLARLLDRLALVPWLTAVTLKESAASDLNNTSLVQFTINAVVRQVPVTG